MEAVAVKQGTRVIVTRWHVTGRPKTGDTGTTYRGTVIKSNGSKIAVQCDNNGPRVWVRREKVTAIDTSPAPAADSAGCTQAAGALA
jgi:hypothetical protein